MTDAKRKYTPYLLSHVSASNQTPIIYTYDILLNISGVVLLITKFQNQFEADAHARPSPLVGY